MGSKIDRVGEENINNFGSKMVIKEYRKYSDIDIYFPEYNCTVKNREYSKFKKGQIRCPYERKYFETGYLGEGNYKVRENGKLTRVFSTWNNMLRRCYSEKYHEKQPTYKECTASEEFHNFQNFGDWDSENFYTVDNERMCLDKDILVKHNKIYSPETCIYVPQTINNLFIKRNNKRGDLVIGTHYYKNGKYVAQCHIINPKTGKSKQKTLGYYDTEIEAFKVYKYHKEKNIKMVADYFKSQIPQNLHDGLYNYIVEITD